MAAKKLPEEAAAEGEKPARRGFLSAAAADAIGVASSLVAGAAMGWTYVESRVYKNLSSLGMFEDMKPKRKEAFNQIKDSVEQGKITSKEAFTKLDALIESNERGAQAVMQEMGAPNFARRWQLLRTHQKVEAGILALAAGGVALGSVLELTRDMIAKTDKDSEEKSQGPTK